MMKTMNVRLDRRCAPLLAGLLLLAAGAQALEPEVGRDIRSQTQEALAEIRSDTVEALRLASSEAMERRPVLGTDEAVLASDGGDETPADNGPLATTRSASPLVGMIGSR
jgi:hypothetical protein